MDWSLCAWCGKDFERREVPAAAAIESIDRGRDATGRYAVAAPTESGGATAPTVLPSSIRTPGSSRSATGQIPASAQDPLPER
jgi:hypothetical protein